MTIISLKDYAKQNRISYEAVRQQVVRYQDELAGHLIRDGRQQFLDEEAVAFLDARRKKNPVAIIQMDKDETIDRLKQNENVLLTKIAQQADTINALQQFKIETMEKRQLLEDAQAAQERRQQELDQREADMAETVKTAVLEATEATKEEMALLKDKEVEKARQEATEAGEAALKQYAAEVAAYNALPGWRRLFAKAPELKEVTI